MGKRCGLDKAPPLNPLRFPRYRGTEPPEGENAIWKITPLLRGKALGEGFDFFICCDGGAFGMQNGDGVYDWHHSPDGLSGSKAMGET